MNNTVAQIEIKVSGTITMDLTEADIKKIIEAGGDYDVYIENMSYSRYDIDDIEVDSRKYSKTTVQNAIADYIKKKPEYKGKVQDFKTSIKSFLEYVQCTKEQFENATAKLEEIKLDRELLKQVYLCADIKNPKFELNYVYFDEKNMIATDTRRLAVAPHNTSLNDVYIHKFICEAYCEDETAKLYIGNDAFENECVYLHLKEDMYYISIVNLTRPKFPDYNRIIPSFTDHHMTHMEFIENFYEIDRESEISVVILHNKEFLFLDLNYIPKDIELDFYYNKLNLPVLFKNENFICVVMPMLIDETDEAYALAKKQINTTKIKSRDQK
jgi:hypothetical protein